MSIRLEFFLSVCFGASAALACGASSGPDEPERVRPELPAYSSYQAALGAATLECLGTVSPDTYIVEEGVLRRNFATCREKGTLQTIDNLLALQHIADAAETFVTTWERWKGNFGAEDVTACPTWQRLRTWQQPAAGDVLDGYAGRVGESFTEYAVHSPACADAACAVHDALACAGGFGETFLVSSDPQRGSVTVDPVWWLDDTDFPPEYNPFLSDGYYHAMSFYGSVPGDIYGAVNREGEYCSKYHAGYHYKLRLRALYCAPDWICMTECK